MNLNIVYGRSGTGKSEYIYNDIKEKIGKEKIFLVVPEQCNLSAEKKLFDVTGLNSLINVEVLTLSRMAYRVETELGSKNKHLSKSGKNMIIYDLLNKNKANLNFLGKTDKNVDLVNRMFTELKKHNINNDLLKNVNIDNKYTSLKIQDISKIYEDYNSKLKDRFIDENDSLTMLAENLSKTNMFDNTCIYIDEFLGFTPQEYNVFEELVKKVKEITVCIAIDEINILNKNQDIFYFNKKYVEKLIKIAKVYNASIQEIKLEKNLRFKSEELEFLESHIYGKFNKYEKKTKDIKLFLANNPYTEMEYVFANIHNLVKNCGYRYNEIGIITEDIDNYAEDAKAISNKYDIPLFVDDKKDINQNVLIKFIIALLDVFSNNYSYESVLNYLKVGLLDVNSEDIYLFENYITKWGIKNNKFLKEFNYEAINDIQDKMEDLRKKIIIPLLEFKNNVSNNRTAREISTEIYNFLINNKVNEKLDFDLKRYGNNEISDEYNTSYKILINVLDDIVSIFDDEKMSFEKYKELLQNGLNSCEIGKIPATQDQIILGDIERTRSNKLKVVFLIGLNDGNFPKVNKNEGFLNDNDRMILENNGIELAKTSIDSLYEEQFNIYRSLSTPEEKLYLTYSSSDKAGGSIRPSLLIKTIKRMFPNIIEESDVIERKYYISNYNATFEEALNVFRDYISGNEISNDWLNIINYFYTKDPNKFKKSISGINYSNLACNLSSINIEKLYGNTLKTSVSKIENYRRCPFSFHLTYGLKLKEKEELKMDFIDTGNFMHEVIDRFFKRLDDKGISIKKIEDDELKNIVNEIINELLESSKYYIFSSNAKYRLLTRKLKKVVYESIDYIVYTLKSSDFSVLGHELEFSNTGDFSTIKMDVDDKKVEIIGKIDRVDKAKINDRQYVRIIDYKSSIKDIDINQVMAGLQIQLLTYLDAIEEQTSFESSGILYMSLIDNVVKNAKNLTEEEISRKIRNNFRMKGLVLADISVVKAMDNNVKNGYSDIIPVYLDKEGNISHGKSKVLNSKEFKSLQNSVKDIIKDIAKEILSGKILINPYYYNKKTGCDYCKYKPICMFNTNIKDNEYNFIKKVRE